MKIMKYEIVYIKFDGPSFSWANGEYIIVKKNPKSRSMEICSIENGQPSICDGEFSTCVTGLGTPTISTGKFYHDIRFRKEKLERILKNV
jgi:hypothetical protein